MSGDAASLPCPICAHTGAFESVQSLRDRLIDVSTNKIICPVCQDEVVGLDKLTIHLFSHVQIVSNNNINFSKTQCKPMQENRTVVKVQPKKPKTLAAKNKTTSAPNTPIFVKIYPKLPVISLNTVPVLEISRNQLPTTNQECVSTAGKTIFVPSVKTETPPSPQTDTTCNICGLQFVDANILKMHRCLIHNIDENANINSTRYHCHICPKHFKMRGSLMVHLRVAHFGFSSNNSELNVDKKVEGSNNNQVSDKKITNLERNDNKQWQCDVCRKCFTTKYFLKKHKRLHTGETPYACTQCNKTFTFQQSYHKHLLYHNDEKPHVCNYCGRAFKELSTLHNHQRIHTGEKPFSCETCGKCFRQRVSYLVHRRIHTGVMPYKCTACDKSFRYKVSQRTHKCQAQPPGTVVRQTGDLIEKLKSKHGETDTLLYISEEDIQKGGALPELSPTDQQIHTVQETVNTPALFPEISEANAELARRGVNLSLEDMVSDNFSLISEAFMDDHTEEYPNISYNGHNSGNDNASCISHIEFTPNIEDIIESVPPTADKNMPSPSEILKNLCLSKDDEDYIGISEDKVTNNYDEKDFDELFL